MSRSMYYYAHRKDDSELVNTLMDLASKYPKRGFQTYYGKIRLAGLSWNRKRVLRVYRLLNLKLRIKRKRRLPSRINEKLIVPGAINQTWSIDFMSDSLANGRRFRVLNVIDDYNRESLLNEADYAIPAVKLVSCLKNLIRDRGNGSIELLEKMY